MICRGHEESVALLHSNRFEDLFRNCDSKAVAYLDDFDLELDWQGFHWIAKGYTLKD